MGSDGGGVEVVGHPAGGVVEGEEVGRGVPGYGAAVAGAEDVAAEAEVFVGNGELAQEGGGQVALVAESADDGRLAHGTTHPEEGHVVVEPRGLVDVAIAVAVVGEDDDEGVLPGGGLAQGVDEASQAVVEVVEGIVDLVVEYARGYVPRFVAGEGEQRLHPRTVRLLGTDVGQQAAEHHLVVDAPLTGGLLLAAEVGLGAEVVVAGAKDVAAHVGEVDVATVVEGVLVAGSLEGARQGGHLAALLR